jgi:hypothetical protein
MTSIERTIFALGFFMQQQPVFMEKNNHGAAAIVNRLHEAIVNLGRGQVSEIFQPQKSKKGNPGLPINVEFIQGCSSRLVTRLMKENGMSLRDAAQTVASALRAAGRRGLGTMNAETVINFRDRLLRRRGKQRKGAAPDIALQAYDDPVLLKFTTDQLVQALRDKSSSFF